MADRTPALTLGKQMRTLFDVGALGAMPDRGLLEHFARGDETAEAAFAALVERHGVMVLRVCRHLLADGHLAELVGGVGAENELAGTVKRPGGAHGAFSRRGGAVVPGLLSWPGPKGSMLRGGERMGDKNRGG